VGDASFWVAAERLDVARLAYPGARLDPEIAPVGQTRDMPGDQDSAAAFLLRGWLESSGPVTAAAMAEKLALPAGAIDSALAKIESEGQVLRGSFTPGAGQEWCNRRVLARIHRLTLGRLRREIEPVTTADFLRFLSRWQHVARGSQLHGADGLLQVIRQLQGYEISAAAWESDILPRRVARYEPELLDRLCLSGEVMWGRLSPHPAFDGEEPRRVRPTRAAPLSLFLRQDAEWLAAGLVEPPPSLSVAAREIHAALESRGASFFAEITRSTGRLASEVEDGLWELAAAGLVTADGFENLRALVDPKRRRGEGRGRMARPRHAAGRWALMRRDPSAERDAESFARQLLLRWGVVFRDLTARESLAPNWRDLLVALRRLEARGEIRGGRFVSGFAGEQFAAPEAVDLLRAVRRSAPQPDEMIAAADPLNLSGILAPGARVHPLSGGAVPLLGFGTEAAEAARL
jgi:ATP-dependent Lhr-like helicase